MAKKQQEYGNDSIRQLKGADRVRKRPAVIFGSDGVEGCAHSIFEITPIVRPRDELTVAHHYGSDGHLAHRRGGSRLRQRLAHELLVDF